ncbi:ComF family protein [Actinomyces sp. ZJ308]|uniref:ComF family protein n=1 Tax=Actinomyces sp. ZJ308 TaxID=2708342 RepID=UPI001FBB6F50|nr:ComF family protein [Actinomyces sp. ZJ308]
MEHHQQRSQQRSHRPAAGRFPRSLPATLSSRLLPGLSLGLPVSCAGCGCWETALCPRCRELLEGDPFAVEHADAAGDLGVLALATYTGPVRTMVLGWKNGSREDLSEVMERAGRRLGGRWAQAHPPEEIWIEPPGDRPGDHSGDHPGDHPGDHRAAGTSAALPASPVLSVRPVAALLVVPAPSGIARRLRGHLVAARLADVVARGIADQWAHRGQAAPSDPMDRQLGSPPPDRRSPLRTSPAPLVLSTDLLRRRGGGAHQAGRSSRQRRGNRAVAPRLLAPVAGLPALLVDDVVTTGATLGACARALEEAGSRVLGALALSAAPPPAHASVTVPARVPATAGDRAAPAPRIDPVPPGLSACGDQTVPPGRGTHEKEA